MALLSANTLFHFTKKEFLLNIIEKGFFPRYNREFEPTVDPDFFEDIKDIYIPMVSFCDIPLSSVENHLKIYHHYGIGLSTNWGQKKGLNPVTYIHSNASNINTYRKNINDLVLLYSSLIAEEFMMNKGHKPSVRNLIDKIKKVNHISYEKAKLTYALLSFLKPYKSKGIYRNQGKGYKYYNEKEWRYVPPLTDIILSEFLILFQELNDTSKEEFNKRLESKSISFKASDVKYLIVDDKKEIDWLIKGLQALNNKFPKKFTSYDVQYLTTTIVTCKQISEDF
ncbi:abortive infection system antitoxin AbiGi family protein [Spirosoma endophyticum]|uniref:Putative abortive phage resistance protein AbiGi, antitoxin n=1 Tax=Spirosoma endophyticum TaxID=662367 RepID=A0A1I2FFJ3_9BACT|nr:abortive infection system antitoxin AbiGi family protein [Spirosoma endophyticum]SFF03286.1 Putative abortive phage resistance protein AbiGi, antitoxin [Spirosoma endophyticum]